MHKSRPEPDSGTLQVIEVDSPPRPGRSNEQLLQAYIDGSEQAFEELCCNIGGKLFNFICRFTGNPTRAEDIYQDVLIKVATSAHRFSGGSSASAWIFRIARNAAIDVARFESRRPAVSLDAPAEGSLAGQIAGREDTPAENAERKELLEKINLAVDSLPEEQREAFLLKEEAGLTFDEVGRIMGCGKETAKSRMRYALDKLRNTLGREAKNHGL